MTKDELKDLLKSFNRASYKNDIDLHIHSNISDGKMSPYEIVEQAKQRGKQYISITDHNTVDAYLSTNILRESIIIPGVEFDCLYNGVLIHILGYGFNIDSDELKPFYAKNDSGKKHHISRIFNLRNPKDVITAINKSGGISVLAHPCCYPVINFEEFVRDLVFFGLDGMEQYYPYRGLRGIVKFRSRKEPADIIEKYGLIKTGGSDSHGRRLL